ncbi:MAG: hypothetical protein IKL66_07590 [Clostridia bacterium]|nr:hypothetical protein [Clostridia bacterium]
MSEIDKVTVKGIYKHPQPEGFVTVKQFMFVYRDGVKHLLLRCSNDTETVLRSVRFVLTELDRDGAVLNVRHLSYKDINAEAGETFTSSMGIPLSDGCVDFKISFVRAVSDKHTYKLKGKKAYVYYAPQKALRKSSVFDVGFSVRSFEISQFKTIARLMAGALTLLVIALIVISFL